MTTTTQPKRKPGRPPGTTKPDDERQDRRPLYMDDDLWGYCLRQPKGASEFLRKLAEEHRKQSSAAALD